MENIEIEKEGHFKIKATHDDINKFYLVNFILGKEFIRIVKQQSKEMLNKILMLPGFRKNKIPLDVLEKKMGGKKETYGNACVTLANTRVLENFPHKIIYTYDHDINFYKDEWHVNFKVMVEEPVLIKDSDLDMKFKLILTDIDDYVSFRLHQFADSNPILSIKDGAAEENDMVEIAITAYIDGELFKDGTHTATNIRLRDNIRPKELLSNLIGSKIGDTFSITVTDEDNIPVMFRNQFIGKKVFFISVVVNNIFKCIETNIDDELAITAGYNNLEDWVVSLRDTATKIRKAKEESDKKQIILNHLVSVVSCSEYPDAWANAKLSEYENIRHIVYKDRSSALKSLKESAKQLNILKHVGMYLNIEWDDADKSIHLRNDKNYSDKVLQHLIENVARFEYVDRRTENNDRENRKDSEREERSIAQL